MTTDALSVATLTIYAPLSIAVIYILIKHLPTGILGWLYLFVFTTLRIVGSAMSLSRNSPSASIIVNIGLSPLILATAGILHESRFYRGPRKPRLEWSLTAFCHVIVASGVALVGAGASALQSDHQKDSDNANIRVGIGLLTASWVLLCFWAAVSLLPGHQDKKSLTYGDGTLVREFPCLAVFD